MIFFFDLSFFLSTLSLRRATTYGTRTASRYTTFLSTLSLRRATHWQKVNPNPKIFLSTLSLRRATYTDPETCALVSFFYPRSPCGERRSARSGFCRPRFFYPRSPCGERPGAQQSTVVSQSFSIHALLAESDSNQIEADRRNLAFLSTLSLRRATGHRPRWTLWRGHFLSTLSLRRATLYKRDGSQPSNFSIHALLAESDGHGWNR